MEENDMENILNVINGYLAIGQIFLSHVASQECKISDVFAKAAARLHKSLVAEGFSREEAMAILLSTTRKIMEAKQ